MELRSRFEEAVAKSKLLTNRPSNEILLQLYSLFKQATEGDNQQDPPSNPFDFVAKAKHDAWSQLKGKAAEDCMQEYISLIDSLQ
ncbi:MAG: acyl-CoA-binding protein [Sphingomonadales bacterium]|jgi:diazepam-binding inhibitor (GABA receptor modulating acyl-CoA-binding protein)|nr:acyl-CoA-binding protein [Sphingomonadales bacterium]